MQMGMSHGGMATHGRRTDVHAARILLVEGEDILGVFQRAGPGRRELCAEIAATDAADRSLDRAGLVARVLLGNRIVDTDVAHAAHGSSV